MTSKLADPWSVSTRSLPSCPALPRTVMRRLLFTIVTLYLVRCAPDPIINGIVINPILAGGNAPNPLAVVKIPPNRALQTGFERRAWMPTDRRANFLRLDRIPAVVSRTIGDETNAAFELTDVGAGLSGDGAAHRFDNLEIGAFLAG